MDTDVPTPTAPLVITRYRRVFLVWLALVAPALLLTLHALAIVPIAWQTRALTGWQPAEGAAYVAPLSLTAIPLGDPALSIFEDGTKLPFPSLVGWSPVAREGRGRFAVSGSAVYLSATDNSDPRVNGRVYTVRQPWPLPRWLLRIAMLVALGATLWAAIAAWPVVGFLLLRPPFAVPALVLLAAVVANRAWFFLDFPIVAAHPDSGSYFAVAEQIGSGVWPNFGTRPPLYPLFLKVVYTLVDRALAVAVAQTLLSFAAGLSLVYAAYRWRRALAIPAALVTALFLFGFTTLEHDTAILSESLYASMLMLAFAALLLGLRSGGMGWLGWSSTAMAFAIMTRPAGVFLLVTFLIVVAWLIWRRYRWRAVAAFALPLSLLMVALSIYNRQTSQVTAPTAWGEANLAVATFVLWQNDPSYPPEIQRDVDRIRAIIQARFDATGKDPSVIYRSWDPSVLGSIFVESFSSAALDIASIMGGKYETTGRQWIRRIAFDSIRKNPYGYGKFVYAMLANYYRPVPEYDFRVYLQNRSLVYYVQRYFIDRGNPFMPRLAKEFAYGTPPPAVVITNPDPDAAIDLQDRVIITPTRAWRVYNVTSQMRRWGFQRVVWPLAMFAALAASCVVLWRTRLRHDGAFAIFIVTISAIGASLVVSLVEYSQPRYSYPMEWVYGMSVVLLPLLFMRNPERSERGHRSTTR